MQADEEEQGRSWLLILVCVVFAAGFGLAGVVMGMLPLSKLVTDHWQSLSYSQTVGDVVDVRLNAGKDAKQGVSALRVLYTFDVAGKTYQGARIGLGTGFDDNISTHQQTWNAKLQKAMERSQKIPVFYNDKNPDESILDRDMRWGLFAGLLAMATFFPALGLALLWCANGLFVNGRLPISALADVAQWRKRKNARRRTVASVTPTISPNPAVLGQAVNIRFDLPPATASVEAMSTMSNRAEITLRCIAIPARGTDQPRRKLWAQRASDPIDHDGMSRTVAHNFLLPANLLPTSKNESESVRWELQLIEPGTPDPLVWEMNVVRAPAES